MLDYVENTVTGRQTPVSRYDYTIDDLGRHPGINGHHTGLELPPSLRRMIDEVNGQHMKD